MNIFGKNPDDSVIVVAEIGVNHEGNPNAAHKMLELAAAAGADAAKFQTYTPERYVATDDAERLARVTRFALSEEDLRALAKHAAELGIGFFSSALTEDVVPLLAELGPAIKIASGDITFEPVIRAAAATGRIVILSTGAATEAEVDRAVQWVADEIGSDLLADRLVLLHCVSAYPTPFEQANLNAIPYMAARYQPVNVGYSNHVQGPEAVIAAVALGADLVEVHFTDCNRGREFRDHALSADPDDMRYLTGILPGIRAARGAYAKNRQACEGETVDAIRKGLIAARDLPAGTVLQASDLAYARPGTEYPCGELALALGKTLDAGLAKGALIRRANLMEKVGI